MRPRLIRPAYFFWIAVLAGGFAGYQLYGLPHAIWSYRFYGGDSNDFASRYYTQCTFVGPYGVFTVPARNGRCGWIAFFKAKEGR